MTEPKTAAAITKASKSNLALAFVALPPERRQDITTFYAFCRLVDDVADDPALSAAEKRRRIGIWRESIATEFAGEPAIAPAVREIIRKYMIQRTLFAEILDGVEMDIEPRRYAEVRGPADLLLPGRLRRRSGEHRDFRLPGRGLQTIRGRARHGAAIDQYPARHPGGLGQRRAHLPSARGPRTLPVQPRGPRARRA